MKKLLLTTFMIGAIICILNGCTGVINFGDNSHVMVLKKTKVRDAIADLKIPIPLN